MMLSRCMSKAVAAGWRSGALRSGSKAVVAAAASPAQLWTSTDAHSQLMMRGFSSKALGEDKPEHVVEELTEAAMAAIPNHDNEEEEVDILAKAEEAVTAAAADDSKVEEESQVALDGLFEEPAERKPRNVAVDGGFDFDFGDQDTGFENFMGGTEQEEWRQYAEALGYEDENVKLTKELVELRRSHVQLLEQLREKDLNAMSKTFKAMAKADVNAYNLMIEACMRARRIDLAFKYLTRMHERHLMPNTRTMNILIRGVGHQGHLGQAVELYKTMRKDVNEFVTEPDAETYTALIHAACVAKDADAAFKYFNIMIKENHQPREVHFMSIFRLVFEQKNWELACHVYRTLSKTQLYVPSARMVDYLLSNMLEGEQLGRELWSVQQTRQTLYVQTKQLEPVPRSVYLRMFDAMLSDKLFKMAKELIGEANKVGVIDGDELTELEEQLAFAQASSKAHGDSTSALNLDEALEREYATITDTFTFSDEDMAVLRELYESRYHGAPVGDQWKTAVAQALEAHVAEAKARGEVPAPSQALPDAVEDLEGKHLEMLLPSVRKVKARLLQRVEKEKKASAALHPSRSS